MRGSGLTKAAALLLATAGLLAAPGAAGASVGKFGMAVQPDGKIVVAGGAGIAIGKGRGKEPGAVVRYTPDGKLDRSFGRNGVALVRSHSDFTGPIQPFTAVALQPNGRILLTSPIGELSRLLPNGELDHSFGVGGIAPASTISAYYPTSVGVLPGGSILVGGTTGYLNDPAEHLYGRLHRYSADGKASTWVDSMSPSTSVDDPKSAMSDFLIDRRGRVIAAGSVGPRPPAPPRLRIGLARLLSGPPEAKDPQDRPDPTFGGGAGLVTSNFFPALSFPETANALAWDRDKIVVAGQGRQKMLVARYRPNGIPDLGFGSGGVRISGGTSWVADSSANAVVVQPSGRIVIAGSGAYGCPSGDCASIALARFRADGRMDRSFGSYGVVSPRVDVGRYGRGVTEIAYGVANLPDERVLVGGLLTVGKRTLFFLRRYLSDGSPDGTFGTRGRVTTLPLRAARRG
jgi:uncharacterized delta-60 repeat protein